LITLRSVSIVITTLSPLPRGLTAPVCYVRTVESVQIRITLRSSWIISIIQFAIDSD